MNRSIREEFEQREHSFMSPYGCLSADSKGRKVPETPCPIRTVFQLDKDRIVYSNAFRRLKHKTQVFLSPLGDQYRTRLTHTLEVAQIARNVSRAMHMNEDLAEAIALGHDLGHTPFGHGGETALKEIYTADFSHTDQSLRVVETLENHGGGLNLTWEVRDGILKHSKGFGKIMPDDPEELAATIEGQIVRIADIIAYLNHDLDDAIRSGVISESQIPDSCIRILGKTHSERVTTMIKDLVFSSQSVANTFRLSMSENVFEAMSELRVFLYDNVYRSERVHREFVKAKKILSELYTYFMNNGRGFEQEMHNMEMEATLDNSETKERKVCDMIASMTDRYALDLYAKLFFPKPMV